VSALVFSVAGRLDELDVASRARLLERSFAPDEAVAATVRDIISEVATSGDAALLEMARRFDGVELAEVEVGRARRREALRRTPADLVEALQTARDRIEAFHRRQLPVADEVVLGAGIRLGRRPEPLPIVGAYAPGGRAAYPSSVLMCAVPARLAGVNEVLVCTPPSPACPDGAPADVVLAACELAGVDRVFAVGGAGAVAALAHGTASIPRADKVVGPGNAWVTEAKRQLVGRIASDCLAGPSELLVIADAAADPRVVAREMIAQAEHDPDAVVVALLTDASLEPALRGALADLVAGQPRGETVRAALASAGAILVAADRTSALEFASAFAPEHLLLLVDDPHDAMRRVRGAGAIFLGASSSVVFGDYVSGTNHVLPTAGQGRSASGLSVADFVRWSTWQQIDAAGAGALAGPAAVIAAAEGLPGHAAAARAWTDAVAVAAPRPVPLRRRDDYAGLSTYDPGRTAVEIDLSDNTNLFGQAPSAVAVLRTFEASAARHYPSLYGAELKDAAARYFGVAEDNIATGCGSDDLIDATVRAFGTPGDTLAYARPTFSIIASFARANGVVPQPVDLAPDFALDVDALAATSAQLTYVCRPNNPTGNAFDRRAVESLARRAKGLLIVDEAYGDFCADPLVAWAPGTDRAVVLRTLSKAFGLAGLRIGIAVGAADVIAEIEKARGPYKVSVVAEAAGAAALRDDAAWIAASVESVAMARERLAANLTSLGLRVWPSTANFLLVQAPRNDARGFAAALAAGGIGVRAFAELPGAGDCVRITIGPAALMDRLLRRIEEITRS
jgi:histidinol dehydrogenase